MDESDPALPRPKRQKVDKTGKTSAFEKLKNLRGSKHKLELGDEVDNVYDTVDEDEYAKRVRDRAAFDWIEDDGTGYVEDGREIFDDAYSDDEKDQSTSKNKTTGKSKKRLRDHTAPSKDGRGSIRSLFSNVVPKNAKVDVEDDALLAGLLGELSEEKATVVSASQPARAAAVAIRRISVEHSAPTKRSVELSKTVLKPSAELKGTATVNKPASQFTNKFAKKLESKQADTLDEKANRSDSISDRSSIAPVAIEMAPPPMQTKNATSSALEEDDSCDIDFNALDNAAQEVLSVSALKKPTANVVPEISEKFLHGWENCYDFDNEEIDQVNMLEKCDAIEENGSPESKKMTALKFWYWEAWEDAVKCPGQLYLFGKMPVKNGGITDYRSLSLQIENVEYCLYLLPRKYIRDPDNKANEIECTMQDVFNEFSETISKQLGISEFRTRNVTKSFAFTVPGVDVPFSSEYLEVRYSRKFSTPSLSQKFNTIAHIFGTTDTTLETFFLSVGIKGPCWLDISEYEATKQKSTWCKVEYTCKKWSCVQVDNFGTSQPPPPPPLVLATLNIRTAVNAKTSKNEVVMISCLVNQRFALDKPPPKQTFHTHFCGVTRPMLHNWPLDLTAKLAAYKKTKVTKCDSEKNLLNWFLSTFHTIDPDIVVTFDAADCQLDVLCDRIITLRVPLWSRLGKLSLSVPRGKVFRNYFAGRMICDVKKAARDSVKSRDFDLDTLCQTILHIDPSERMDVSNTVLYEMYDCGDTLMNLITLTMQDCAYILRLLCELNVLPLALQLTKICGNTMAKTLLGGRAERNDFLLLHAFKEKDFLPPDRKVRNEGQLLAASHEKVAAEHEDGQTTSGDGKKKKGPSFMGGLVLEPKRGFYDKYILLMDFNSLYPSIIQEYNICFTTISPSLSAGDTLPILPDPGTEQGILPRQIRRLVDSRREVKRLMDDPNLTPELRMQYNIRQLALKLTANSMYGCLGYDESRFYAKSLAALVTHKGREILMNTKSLVENMGLQVIYGDTDSIMVNANCEDYDRVFSLGNNVKQAVNKVYRHVELDIDGVFKYLLLLRKKKYAAVTIKKRANGEFIYTEEYKGLDIVRRDWSAISVRIGKAVLKEILSDATMDERVDRIHKILETCAEDFRANRIDVTELMITKQLSFAPVHYKDKSQPHVQVAVRMNEMHNRRYKKGDMVNYVVCTDGTDRTAGQRAYHVDEVRDTKNNETLKIDTQYYLAQQVHPVVTRLCEPIAGTDASRIAACLGLDTTKYRTAVERSQREHANDEAAGQTILKTKAQKFRFCNKFTFKCVECGAANDVASAFRTVNGKIESVLAVCANSECQKPPYLHLSAIKNALVLAIRSHIRRFYENWLVCDESSCNNNTRMYTHVTERSLPVCVDCKSGTLVRQYSEGELYTQLTYYQYMFDLSKHTNKPAAIHPDVLIGHEQLTKTVNQFIAKSGYCIIKTSHLFAMMQPASAVSATSYM